MSLLEELGREWGRRDAAQFAEGFLAEGDMDLGDLRVTVDEFLTAYTGAFRETVGPLSP